MAHGVSTTTLKGYIDNAKQQGCWLVLLVHDIVESNAVPPRCLKAEFDEIVDYCNSSGVEVLTYSQIAERIRATAIQTIQVNGSGTISSGTTSVNIRHGFSETPTSIQITPTSSLGLASQIWVSSKDTGTGNLFTVSVNTDPGMNVTFNWQALL